MAVTVCAVVVFSGMEAAAREVIVGGSLTGVMVKETVAIFEVFTVESLTISSLIVYVKESLMVSDPLWV